MKNEFDVKKKLFYRTEQIKLREKNNEIPMIM